MFVKKLKYELYRDDNYQVDRVEGSCEEDRNIWMLCCG